MTPEYLSHKPSSVERLTECALTLRIRRFSPVSPENLGQTFKISSTDTRAFLTTEKESVFKMIAYKGAVDGKDHIAVIKDVGEGKNVPIRIHSSCLTAETFHASTCDCEGQLNFALSLADEQQMGGVIWLNQEGMGNGLAAKLAQIDYESRTGKYDPVTYHGETFIDRREYNIAVEILKDLGISSIQLITNNPSKINEIQQLGIKVVSRIPCIIDAANKQAISYLEERRRQGYLG